MSSSEDECVATAEQSQPDTKTDSDQAVQEESKSADKQKKRFILFVGEASDLWVIYRIYFLIVSTFIQQNVKACSWGIPCFMVNFQPLTSTTRRIFLSILKSTPLHRYYRKRGSASYYCASVTFVRGRERERERERRLWRHWYHAEIASDHAYDYLDGAQTQRVDASGACRVLELRSACKENRSLALERSIEQQGRVIDERRWGSGSFAFAGQTAVDHPAAFRWHASSKKNRKSWCLFPFRMAMVLPLRTAWIADILSQASLRDVERQRCWKRGSGDFGTTLRHDWAIFSSMPLTGEVRRSPEPFARPSAAADSEERQICTTCLFAESVGLCLCFLPSCAMYKDNAVRNVAAEMGRDLVFMITARVRAIFPCRWKVRFDALIRGERWIVKKTTVLLVCMLSHVCFLPSWSWSTLLFERGLGEEGRFDVASRSQTPKTSCQNHKQ